MAAPVLVATVVAGFAGFTVSRLVDTGDSGGASDTAVSSAGDAAAPQVLGSGPPRTVVEPSAERLLSTGTDYTPDSLPGTVSSLSRQGGPTGAAATQSSPRTRASGPAQEGGDPYAATSSPDRATADTPCCLPLKTNGSLERLTDRSVLAACLDAIAVAHAQGPLAVDLVDYATFEGRAALVVVFTDRSGAKWAWVTGPDCGSAAAGADVTYQSRVG
jgi:hypothetical protein